jgi:hypothetical protein
MILPPAPPSKIAAGGTFCAILSGLVMLGLPARTLAADTAAPQAAPPAAAAAAAAPAPAAAADKDKAPAAEPAKEKEGEAAAETKPEEPPPGTEAAPGDYRNWFETSVGGLIVDGDKASAQRRTGLPASAFGGVQAFHYEHDVGKKGIFKVDGRGIFDNQDYGLRLEWNETDKGFVRGGVSQHRDFYDGTGGWSPSNGQHFPLYNDQFAVIRGNAFFEAGLRLPAKPEITVRYDRDWREGFKDSTIWGPTSLTGGVGTRSIVPAFQRLDEHTDTIAVDLRHTLGKTTLGAGFTFERAELSDSLNLRRQPFEPSDRFTTQTTRVESDLYGARAFVDTPLGEKVRFTSSYAFTTLETQVAGSRIIGADYDPVYDPAYGRRDVGFLNLSGLTQLDQNVWNANVMWTPFPTLSVIPAFRVENQNTDGSATRLDTGAQDLAREAANSRDMLDLSQQLEVRYTGITNILVYARGDWVQGDGNLLESEMLSASRQAELHRDTDFDRFSQKYTVGANWYPRQRLSVHTQYYRKMRENSYQHDPASYVNYSGLYPAFIQNHDFVTDDANVRLTWRPIDKLTLVTRYDLQFNTIHMQGTGLGEQQSAEQTAHIIGETITWTPTSRLYIQPGVNYVLDTTKSAATSVPTFPGNPVEDAHNDYFTVTCTTGLVLDDRTDLQLQYNYYLADNFRDVSAITQPYGADAEEHGVIASLIRRVNPRLKVTLRYGYYSGRSEFFGGFNDYDAHLVYASTQYLF